MSVKSEPTSEECGYCKGPRPNSVEGSYCSIKCYYLEKGEGPLRRIREDHKVCATCFSRIKEVETPPEGTSLVIGPVEHDTDAANHHLKDVLTGFEYPTEHAEHIQTTIRQGRYAVGDTVATALGCSCGTSCGADSDTTIERSVGGRVAANLFRELRIRYELGGIDNEPDKDAFMSAIEEQGRDWAYVIGKALYGTA